MFTGIIEAVGSIKALEPRGGDVRLHIRSGKLDLSDVALGDSIATNGVCLTVIELPGDGYAADVSLETLSLTTLGTLRSGSPVNLEKALTLQTRLGGHMVSGHVDGLGNVVERVDSARSVKFIIEAPQALAKYIVHKGSITVDGISLTVNAINNNRFELNIVPHTVQETVIGQYQVGTKVNLEVDLIVRYLERLLWGAEQEKQSNGITERLLTENGFMK
ncbi:MAG: riboflavin synthase [Gammaproteobacteria bacterium]|nr:riboflavin synthase [Gammaproteobacteria bacterium]